MRKTLLGTTCCLFILSGFDLTTPHNAYGGHSSFNLSIGINGPAVAQAYAVPAPPPYVINTPPPVVVIPGTYVYAVPTADISVFFHGGYWYRPYRNYWYRASYYNGPWRYVAPARVPVTVVNSVHYDYRHAPPHRHIPYGHLKKNWRKWEKEKYWERHPGY